ncbi:hypothetical protein ABZ215_42375 [Amycolatopsis sp. NPDC006131]|uniref:hypothetical protein n=1 Tax=Amycolatopsis sp. NPDC006131 TaxID=3156731 RepID=UPI0033AE57DA
MPPEPDPFNPRPARSAMLAAIGWTVLVAFQVIVWGILSDWELWMRITLPALNAAIAGYWWLRFARLRRE